MLPRKKPMFLQNIILAYFWFEDQMNKTVFSHSNLLALTVNEPAACTEFALEVAKGKRRGNQNLLHCCWQCLRLTDSQKARNQNYVHRCYLQLTDSLWSANSFCFLIITELHERRHEV